MMKSLAFILVSFVFVACAPVPKELSEELPNTGMLDKTDTNTCKGNTPAGTSVYRSWHVDLQSSSTDYQEQRMMTVEGNAITMTTTCKYGSSSTVSVKARANASISMNTIQTTSHDDAEVTTNVSGKNRICSANIPSGQIMTYTFKGPCLQVSTSGQSQLMLP